MIFHVYFLLFWVWSFESKTTHRRINLARDSNPRTSCSPRSFNSMNSIPLKDKHVISRETKSILRLRSYYGGYRSSSLTPACSLSSLSISTVRSNTLFSTPIIFPYVLFSLRLHCPSICTAPARVPPLLFPPPPARAMNVYARTYNYSYPVHRTADIPYRHTLHGEIPVPGILNPDTLQQLQVHIL